MHVLFSCLATFWEVAGVFVFSTYRQSLVCLSVLMSIRSCSCLVARSIVQLHVSCFIRECKEENKWVITALIYLYLENRTARLNIFYAFISNSSRYVVT